MIWESYDITVKVQVIEEHRLVFRLNNSIIQTFPMSIPRGIVGVIKIVPVEIVLILISLLMAFFLMWYTRSWIESEPDTIDFANPDFVQPE